MQQYTSKPMSYKTTEEFLRLFGYSSLDELPELPRYKMDENHQIVIEELEENNEIDESESKVEDEENDNEKESKEEKV